ncbi:MAG: hypothetical protein HY867_09760 [Chloroflexi bacterium]|nr:hypothetical protein [Chloroflexota bacterium]
MRDWNLTSGDPLHLTLAADFRFGGVDYLNDQIWELDFASGEPRSLSLRTTFGLRARSMRVFPRFGEGRGIVTDPAKFVRAPRLKKFYPNFLELDFSPLENLDVTAEFWAAGSQVIAGRYTLVNCGPKARKIRLELCAILAPLDGQAFFAAQSQMVNVVTGTTGGLAPLLYMTGGPNSITAPYPALTVELDLAPNASRSIAWALAALAASGPSYELARKTVARNWDAEKARIEMSAESQTMEIETGDPDWDAAFAFTQTAALRSFLPASETLPNPSFVLTRAPDHGFSRKGDGADYPLGWAGQSPLEAYALASLLPGAPQYAKGLLRNFLSTQNEDGFVDLRPGLAGQRAKMLAAPLLASLAWQTYQASNDDAFLAEVFPSLLKFFWNWFSPAHDRDRDGLPEWDHLLQTGWDENPLFDVWNPWSQGMDIGAAENPSLYAMLAREAACLILIAEKLGRGNEVTLVQHQAELLDNAVAASWDESAALYSYRDLVTRLSLAGQVVAKGKGRAALKPKKEFERPVRLLIEIQSKSPAAKRPEIRLAEMATKEPVEVIAPEQFVWRSGGLVATTRNVYEKLGRVDVIGLDAADKIVVRAIDLTAQDHTLLLPLWAGLPDQQRAQTMIGRALLDASRFDKPFGLPALASCPTEKADAVCSSVHLRFNQLIGEGLLAYGFHTEAARLVEHIMAAVVKNLKETRAFHQRHHAETGAPIGERHALTGLAPLGLFLQTLSVTIHSATRVRLEGKNPFPWPVTIRYRGLTVKRGLESTEVIFANGKSVMVMDSKPCIVAL